MQPRAHSFAHLCTYTRNNFKTLKQDFDVLIVNSTISLFILLISLRQMRQHGKQSSLLCFALDSVINDEWPTDFPSNYNRTYFQTDIRGQSVDRVSSTSAQPRPHSESESCMLLSLNGFMSEFGPLLRKYRQMKHIQPQPAKCQFDRQGFPC